MKKKKIAFFFLSSIFLLFTILFIMIVSIPNNPISYRYKLYINKNVNALLPEGWAFFTRDCKEEQIYIYEIESNKIKRKISLKVSNQDQLFGLNRHNRIMHSKLSTILSSINENYYYKDKIQISKLNLSKVNEVNVKINNSSLCAKYLLKLEKPRSWTWFSTNIKNPPINTYRLVIINFQCI